ncbi:unnamed protein product [Spirodela intermedia]|uniref:Uncharacterized protein n=1 Tax=Spirodela intermedia TaxID=51605 RepID=A0A7I8IX34_SPIIN|nr:unnamed protein product [Spirodela intermedia]CAA6662341.1 unnamed protein product [Spirodela intermedia]
MVYHSSFVNDDGVKKAFECPLLHLKTHIKGLAPGADRVRRGSYGSSIIFFLAKVLFKHFNVQSSADKLPKAPRPPDTGSKAIINLGLETVPVPVEQGFPFSGLFTPQSKNEALRRGRGGGLFFAELLRNYLKQIREETSGKLLSCVYRHNGTPNKWWLTLAKRTFMDMAIPQPAPSLKPEPPPPPSLSLSLSLCFSLWSFCL